MLVGLISTLLTSCQRVLLQFLFGQTDKKEANWIGFLERRKDIFSLSQAPGVITEKQCFVSTLTCSIKFEKYLSQLDTVGNIIKDVGCLCC